MPNVDVPVIVVLISQYGASPAELELQVTKKVEDAVAGVAGAHHINSSITDGLSNAEFTSNAMLGWAKDHAVSRASRMQKGYVKSFNGPCATSFSTSATAYNLVLDP